MTQMVSLPIVLQTKRKDWERWLHVGEVELPGELIPAGNVLSPISLPQTSLLTQFPSKIQSNEPSNSLSIGPTAHLVDAPTTMTLVNTPSDVPSTISPTPAPAFVASVLFLDTTFICTGGGNEYR